MPQSARSPLFLYMAAMLGILPLLRDSESAPNFADEGMQVGMEVLFLTLKHLSWQAIYAIGFVGFATRDG